MKLAKMTIINIAKLIKKTLNEKNIKISIKPSQKKDLLVGKKNLQYQAS